MMSLVALLRLALIVYSLLIFVRAMLSWFPLRAGTPSYKAYGILYDVTEPYLRLFRRVVRPVRIGDAALDLSALVGLVVLYVALRLLALV